MDEAGRPLIRFAVDGSAFTPDDGRFEVETLNWDLSLTISAAGYTSQQVEIGQAAPLKELGDVTMKRGKQLRVQVHTAGGRPLEGVRVTANQAANVEDCTTKGDGRCVIEPLSEEVTTLATWKEGYVPASATLEARQLEQEVTLTVSVAGGRLVGQAFAQPSRPAPARRISISGAVSKSVMTDSAGRFTAEGLPEGPYCVALDSSDLRGSDWAVPAQASPTPSPVELGPLGGGGTVAGSRILPGRLVLIRGAIGPQIAADLADKSAKRFCEAQAAPVITTLTLGGDFRVEGVAPGRWSAFHVSMTQAEEQGLVEPWLIELSPNQTQRIP